MIVVSLCSVFLIAVVGLHAKNKSKAESEETGDYLPEAEPILLSAARSEPDYKGA